MDIFKEASKKKLRVPTPRGNLSVEQLWDLNLPDLDTLAIGLQKDYDESKGKSFLTKASTKDRVIKLQFDIVLSILKSKVDDDAKYQAKLDAKARNEKIATIIETKKDEELKNLSIKDLEKMLK